MCLKPFREWIETKVSLRWEGVDTCVVVFGAVAKVHFIFQHKLGQHQLIRHLDWTLVQPFKEQVIHGITNYMEREGERERTVCYGN